MLDFCGRRRPGKVSRGSGALWRASGAAREPRPTQHFLRLRAAFASPAAAVFRLPLEVIPTRLAFSPCLVSDPGPGLRPSACHLERPWPSPDPRLPGLPSHRGRPFSRTIPRTCPNSRLLLPLVVAPSHPLFQDALLPPQIHSGDQAPIWGTIPGSHFLASSGSDGPVSFPRAQPGDGCV